MPESEETTSPAPLNSNEKARTSNPAQRPKREDETAPVNETLGWFKQAFDVAAVGLTHCSRDLRYLAANQAYAEIAGVAVEQIVGRPIVEVMGESGFAAIRPYVERVLAGDEVEYESEVPWAARGTRWLRVRYKPKRDRDGSVAGWFATVTDVTDYRGAEEALARAAEAAEEAARKIAADLRDTTLLQSIGALCARPDAAIDDCLRQILDAAITIAGADMGNLQRLEGGVLGIAAERGFNRPFLTFFDQVEAGEAATCGAAFQAGARVIVEDVERSPIFAGQPALDVLLNAGVRAVQSTPLLSSSGQVLGMISTHMCRPHRPDERQLRFLDLLARQAADFLERKRAEEALQVSEQRLALALAAGKMGVWDWDPASDRVMWSDEEYALFGVDKKTFTPTASTLRDFVLQEDLGRVYLDRTSVDALEAPIRNEFRIRRPDGQIRWMAARADPLRDKTGATRRVVGVNFDITDRKQAEEELRALNERLETRVMEETAAREAAQQGLARSQQLAALGQLAGGVAHDFNNVLQAVTGALQLIARSAGDPEAIRRFTRLAHDATARGAASTERLLAFARRSDLHASSVEPERLLAHVRELLASTLSSEIAIELATDPGTPPAWADARQLETVLVNLAINASDAMPQGGRLTISASPDRVDPGGKHPARLPAGDYVRLDVADTGVGMDAATLAHCLDPFFTTKPVGKGTGLGLSLAQGFAEQSGGGLAVKSEPGRGTTVTLWLPKATAAAELARIPPPPEPELVDAPVTVLVVDDDPLVLGVLAAQLSSRGYRVSEAADGFAAVARLDAGFSPDLLVTDFAMPGMNGVRLIDEARRRRPELPAIVITGYADANLDRRGLGPETTLLHKPVSDLELTSACEALTGRLNQQAART